MKEVWAPVEGFECLYEVSNFGRVKGLRFGRVLKPTVDAYGYLQVGLHAGLPVPVRTAKVHRLVAKAFLGPQPGGKPEVDHRDFDRANNRVDNLRWITVQGNRYPAKPRGKSGVVGVRFRPGKPNPWQAYFADGGTMKSLGHFAEKCAAISARKAHEETRIRE